MLKLWLFGLGLSELLVTWEVWELDTPVTHIVIVFQIPRTVKMMRLESEQSLLSAYTIYSALLHVNEAHGKRALTHTLFILGHP